MMPYPTQAVYESLYARYFEGTRTEQLLALAGPLEGKRVVDLCGGSGRLSLLALAQGAVVRLVDESSSMLNGIKAPGLQVTNRPVEQWLECFAEDESYDAMFCQQAVNYWFTDELSALVAAMLRPGGKFIFNTFNTRPPLLPTPKTYERNGAGFVELSWLVPGLAGAPDMVEHVQIREGSAQHTTRFKWISPEEFRSALAPWFSLDERVDGPATVWSCTKR